MSDIDSYDEHSDEPDNAGEYDIRGDETDILDGDDDPGDAIPDEYKEFDNLAKADATAEDSDNDEDEDKEDETAPVVGGADDDADDDDENSQEDDALMARLKKNNEQKTSSFASKKGDMRPSPSFDLKATRATRYEVPKDERITSDRMTLFEQSEYVSIRSADGAVNNNWFVDISGLTDPVDMAKRELMMRKSPLQIVRQVGNRWLKLLPDGTRSEAGVRTYATLVEIWDPNEMIFSEIWDV